MTCSMPRERQKADHDHKVIGSLSESDRDSKTEDPLNEGIDASSCRGNRVQKAEALM